MGVRFGTSLVCLGLVTVLSSCSDDRKPTAPEKPAAAVDGMNASDYGEMSDWFAKHGVVLPEEVPAQPPVGKATQENERVLGDATGEGVVDGSDLALLWVYLTAFPFLTQHYDFDMLDIDRDGDYDWDDLYILGKHLYATPTPQNTYRIGEPLTRPDEIAYNIDLVFVPGHGFSASQMVLFEQAAERWEAIITDDIPDIDFTRRPWRSADTDWWADWAGKYFRGPIVVNDEVDDIRIFVTSYDTDDFWGRASWFWYRTANDLPILSMAVIASAVLKPHYERDGSTLSTMIHELGHALGFDGSTWERRNLIVNPSRDNPGVDTYFRGWRARNAFNRLGGRSYRGGGRVPVENGGVLEYKAGRDGHWRGTVFGNEMMSTRGWRLEPLSEITIQAMADIGYKVDATQADPYRIPAVAKPVVASRELFCRVMPPPPVASHEGW